MSRDDRLKQKKQLVLAFGQRGNGWQQQREVGFLLPANGSRRVRTRRRKVNACIGTVDFNQPLGPAADRTDRAAQRRAFTPGLTALAQRTDHRSQLSRDSARKNSRLAW